MLATKSGIGVLASNPQRRQWRPEEIARADAVIAEMFNVSERMVERRLAAIPENARAYYAARSLD